MESYEFPHITQASDIEFIDLDNDNDLDVLVGDKYQGVPDGESSRWLQNTGDTLILRLPPKPSFLTYSEWTHFAPIEIDGEWYWDASLVSNTPLQYVIDHNAKVCQDLLLFQVDLFSAEGSMPKNIMEVGRRMKDIQHSSQTRTITDIVRDTQKIRGLINRLLEHIPTESLTEEEIALLGKWSCDSAITLVHLIYRQKNHELASKDYEFSRLSVEEHWQAGEQDIEHMLSQKSWLDRKRTKEEVTVFDFNEMHDSPLV